MDNKLSYYLNYIYLLSAGVGTFLSVMLHISSSEREIHYYILPFFFFVCLILLKRYGSYSSQISILIMEVLMQVRYVVLPISYYLSGNEPVAYNSDYGWSAMAIMIYEMICVILLMNYLAPYYFGENRGCVRNNWQFMHITDIGTFLIIVMFVLTITTHPQYLRNLFTFRFEDFEGVDVDSGINGMYNIIYKTGIITSNCLLLSLLSRRKEKTMLQYSICIVFCWVAIWTASVGTSGMVSRTSFLTNGIIFTLLLMKRFPEQIKKTVYLSLIVVGAMLILGTISRFYLNNSSQAISGILSYETLDSYFGGLRDVSVGLEMKELYGDNIDFRTLWTDVFAGVPYFASRSGLDFNNRIPNYFNGTFFGLFGNISRICPLVAQASTYIGVLFAPTFTCIFVWLGMKFNSKLLETENELEIYMWSLAVYYFSAYSMYNLNIVMGGVWNKILPIFLVIILNRIDLKKGVWRKL